MDAERMDENQPSLHEQLARLERRLEPLLTSAATITGAGTRMASQATHEAGLVVPAWRRATAGEQRWPASLALLVAIGLQVALPERLTLASTWLLPSIEAVVLVALLVANPARISRRSPALRAASLTVIALASLANAWSAVQLVSAIVAGTAPETAVRLLVTGGTVWLTNVIVFALWYWELDRGGPAARAQGEAGDRPDFLFPQMATGGVAPADWEPGFVDYLYVSFTNATAFSPTDTMPLSRWAKLTMLLQSAVSLATVALVVARAINILK